MKNFRRILLIDDDDITCYVNKLLLERMEIADEIDCVHEGLEGLKYIHQHCLKEAPEHQAAPDLIFLDNHMPLMDGFEFLEALEKLEYIDRSRLYIVMLTSSKDSKDIQRAATFGDKLHSYITKPLQINQVNHILSVIPLFQDKIS